ncbi:MAG: hypothetical protein Q8J78_14845 [Moraxellaceae bacterium]|nr:hypothetical protein [Moraxellaceae bacterium]
MKTRLALLLALALPLAVHSASAAAAPAPDLRYTFSEADDSPLLRDYNGEPWWGMLANCAGYYMAASKVEGVPPEVSQALRKQGNFYATVASFRLAKDRGLEQTIHQEVINIATRADANALANGLVATPERQQSMRLLCGAHLNAYERMVPGMELN